ncbi:hypothetical protein ACH5AJ_32775 [Streptomyces rochei]|uniref:hypothetical protein n=1 Tax=Streptomyces TaxID=1883 RepID=UPI000FC24B7B|nr:MULTISPECIES: hypothetical protein [unclassified Streptomyces]RSS24298.1 hypothetical protein EF916_27695 [Streptomyces sp. WAC08452]RSS68596.1 hypothetical protein EF911_33030 [Streptomyces sp. WAC06128]GGY97943.1 hypothetical protein GCM10010385_54800 [Streptomyces geysiriensis]
MSDLLDTVVTARGGLDRWRSVTRLTAEVQAGGALWGLKNQPGVLDRYTISVDLHRQAATLAPFAESGLRAVYTPGRVALETPDGRVAEERVRPRESFAGHTLETPWDRLHAAYFAGYAMWTYLTEPFLFAEPGFIATEIEPWEENGETWRRLEVTFPDHIATHSRIQTYYIDAEGLIRRHDYRPDVFGAADRESAHYTYDHRTVDGLVFPARRSVHLTDEHNRKVAEPVIISIDLTDITVSS